MQYAYQGHLLHKHRVELVERKSCKGLPSLTSSTNLKQKPLRDPNLLDSLRGPGHVREQTPLLDSERDVERNRTIQLFLDAPCRVCSLGGKNRSQDQP